MRRRKGWGWEVGRGPHTSSKQCGDDRNMVGAGRQVQWCVAQAVLLVGVGPMVQEQLHNLVAAIAGSKMEGCPAFVISRAGIRAIFQQLLHCFYVIGIG